MTARVTTRATAALAALLLVLGLTIVAMSASADGEIAFVHAAEQSQTTSASPNGTGNACPENSPQGEEADPACGNEGKGNQGDKDKDKDGDRGKDKDKDKDGETGNACPPNSPNAGGQPPCGDGDDDGAVDCEDPDNADHPECDEGIDCEDPDNADHPECDEQIDCEDPDNADHPDCDEEQVDTQRCDTPDGIELLDDGTIALFLHKNDPTGLSSNPTAEGPLSGAVYDGGKDTPASPLTDEVGCAVSLTGAL